MVTKNEEDMTEGMGVFRSEEGVGKKIDYVAVCTFVYFTLDANIRTEQLTTALRGKDDEGEEENVVLVADPVKAELARTLVDKFLCRGEGIEND